MGEDIVTGVNPLLLSAEKADTAVEDRSNAITQPGILCGTGFERSSGVRMRFRPMSLACLPQANELYRHR
jgi:hypothetical protein